MHNVKCISLRIEDREVSYWVNTGSGVEDKERTRADWTKLR